jgi:hypothetical protein
LRSRRIGLESFIDRAAAGWEGAAIIRITYFD